MLDDGTTQLWQHGQKRSVDEFPLGALQLQQDSGPLPSSAVTSAYDALGRLSSRTVQGAGAETFQYDAIGRLSVHTDDLGTIVGCGTVSPGPSGTS